MEKPEKKKRLNIVFIWRKLEAKSKNPEEVEERKTYAVYRGRPNPKGLKSQKIAPGSVKFAYLPERKEGTYQGATLTVSHIIPGVEPPPASKGGELKRFLRARRKGKKV